MAVSGQYGCLAAQVEGEIEDDRAHGLLTAFRGKLYRYPGERPDAAFELPNAVLRKQAGFTCWRSCRWLSPADDAIEVTAA